MAQTTPLGAGRIKGITPVFPRPEVTGRQAYAPAIEISPFMDLVLFSGLTAYPPDVDPWSPGSFTMPADPGERGRMAAENLDRILRAGGMTWTHIVFNVNYRIPDAKDGLDFRAQYGDWSPCSTSLRVADVGVPGSTVLYQISAAAPHRAITAQGYVPGIEPILPQPGVALRDLPAAPAIRITSDVDLVYFPGVTAYPLDVDPWNPGGYRVPDDLATQERMVADNVDRMLRAAGIGWQHIVLMTRVGEVRGQADMRDRLGDWRPCRTTRAVRTAIPGARVLCEVTAVAPRA
jgi:enamine deaminase RidA (YjgF/YER057c/UK114 family)